MKNFNKNSNGFTLIELLVVVAIIALLLSIVLSSLSTAQARGRDAKRTADIAEVMKALELYYSDNGYYPQFGGGGTGLGSLNDALAKYLSPLPSDPLGNNWNAYLYVSGNSSHPYAILVRYETLLPNSYINGNPSLGGGWCLTGVNPYLGQWWGVSSQCPTIPSLN